MKLSFVSPKKIILLVFLLTNFLSSYGQNWSPVFPNEIFDYKTDTSKRIEQVIKIDSVSGNVYYLNKIASICCFDTGTFLFDYVTNLPGFLQHSIITTDSDFILTSPNKWVVKTHYPLNKEWLYDSANNITAQIISRRSQKKYGQEDSLETILFLPGNDSIVLSKNFGILNFPSGNGHYFIQSGLEKANLGKVRLGFADYYSFDVGDVFQYAQGNYGDNNTFNTYGNWKNTIISKTDLNPGYQYQARHVWNFSLSTYTGGFTESGIDTVTLVYLPGLDDTASYLIYPGKWQVTPYGFYSIGCLIYDSKDQQVGCDASSSIGYLSSIGPFPFPPADICCSPNDTIEESLGSAFGYTLEQGFGLVQNEFDYFEGTRYEVLTGYVKGNDTLNIYPDSDFLTGVGISPLNSVKWFLYPNPARNTIFLSSSVPVANSFMVELISLTGQVVKSILLPATSLRWQISVEDVPTGLYIVAVKSKGQIDYRSKVMVAH